ncbi:MAG: sigma-70 family RNA polymerase sigma factor [Patescibacteria group bacterium]|nr:sigma-70 family RNA polymerase sigma factor [Patescibacteria group bacterium]MDD4304478.1 sigma-70 family RNA polymerase sigma factor [Patescibacteria group bacterium]MDD4694838.1 sigma-70 family RNA polymerase sigma factor [Patescibacteria group bacterium]
MDQNELDLIQKAKNGNSDAFGNLYDIYIEKIYNFIYYKTYHKETAEDITSSTFLKVFTKLNTFNENKSSFSTWIYTIARNTVIDYFRTQKNNFDIEDIWDLSNDENIDIDVENRIQLEKLREYLKKIDKEKREIIILRVWEGLSYKEISEIIGKTEDNCKMTFSRVIRQLRNDMPIALFITLLINKIL